MLSAKHEHVRLLTSAATKGELPGKRGSPELQWETWVCGHRGPNPMASQARYELVSPQETFVSRNVVPKERGRRRPSSASESGVATTVLPPQSKATLGGVDLNSGDLLASARVGSHLLALRTRTFLELTAKL
jgi:hypothetical protein